MPIALARSLGASRNRWLDDYVSLVVERDVMELSRVRQLEVLPRLLAAWAGQTGQLLRVTAAAERAGIEPSTASNYVRLLEAAFLVRRLPGPRSRWRRGRSRPGARRRWCGGHRGEGGRHGSG